MGASTVAGGLPSSGGGEGEDGVDGGFEGMGVTLDLREEQSALKRQSELAP
jgi:hypothetical protein